MWLCACLKVPILPGVCETKDSLPNVTGVMWYLLIPSRPVCANIIVRVCHYKLGLQVNNSKDIECIPVFS